MREMVQAFTPLSAVLLLAASQELPRRKGKSQMETDAPRAMERIHEALSGDESQPAELTELEVKLLDALQKYVREGEQEVMVTRLVHRMTEVFKKKGRELKPDARQT